MSFSDWLFGREKPIKDKQREAALRKVRKIKSKLDTFSDPYWFELGGYKFCSIKHYRGTDFLILSDSYSDKRKIQLLDIENVKFLGYIRQRMGKHGSVDFYTHDKLVKNETRRDQWKK